MRYGVGLSWLKWIQQQAIWWVRELDCDGMKQLSRHMVERDLARVFFNPSDDCKFGKKFGRNARSSAQISTIVVY